MFLSCNCTEPQRASNNHNMYPALCHNSLTVASEQVLSIVRHHVRELLKEVYMIESIAKSKREDTLNIHANTGSEAHRRVSRFPKLRQRQSATHFLNQLHELTAW